MGFLGDMGGETSLYYIVMMAIYTGLGPWVISRLSRSRSAERQETREEVRASLELVEKLKVAREVAQDPDQRQEIGAMIDRLVAESTTRVAALNVEAAEISDKPDRRFLIIPTPRSGLAAIVTVLAIGCVYFGLMFWLTLGFDFWNRTGFDVLANPADQTRALFLAGGGAALLFLALCFRFAAFRLYRAQARRMMRAAEADAARSASAAA